MALLLFQLCVVFTVGLLLGPASVWAGGGGPEAAVAEAGSGAVSGVRGAPLFLPCGAPDPRAAAIAPLKQTNMLDLSKGQGTSSQSKQKNEEYGNSEKKRNFATVPLKDEDSFDDGWNYDGVNDSDYSKGIELGVNRDGISPADADPKRPSDASGDVIKSGKRKHGNRRRPEKKHLESGAKKSASLKHGGSPVLEGPLPTYIWFHNGTEIDTDDPRRTIFANGTLFFKRFGSKKGQKGLQDSGVYRCLAKGDYGAMLSTSVTLSYAVLERDFTHYPVNSEIIEGDALQLLCSIISSPSANISWEKNSQRLPDNKRYYISVAGSLIITNTQKGDEGEYRCVAANTFLNKTRYSPPASVVILNSDPAKYPLEFVSTDNTGDTFMEANSSLRVTTVSVLFGENIALGCAVKGMPKPKVTWNFKSDSSDIEAKEMSSMEVLRITSALEDNAGLYTCIATNGFHSIQQAYQLSVLRAPYLMLIPVSEHTPAAKTVRFNCTAGGSPKPTLTWFKDGLPLSITGRIKLKISDTKPPELIITDTISSDKGVYQCIASNSAGEASAWAALSVKSPLGVPPPVSVKCLPITPQSLKITWEPPPGLEALAYTVHFFFADGGEEHSQVVNAQTKEYIPKNLEPFAKYEMYTKIYAKPNGASDQSPHAVCHGQGVTICVYAIDNSSMLVSWLETAAETKTIKVWKVQWRLINGNSSSHTNNVTVAANVTTFIIEDIYPLKNYEFRVLASPTEEWLDQDLSLIVWTPGDRAIPLPAYNKEAHFAQDELSNQKHEPAIGLVGGSQIQPTHLLAEASGPRSVNLTWRCDAAESSLDGWIFVVCFTRYDETGDDSEDEKYKEKCTDSLTNWIEITGLDPGSLYGFKVQAIMQNQQRRGPFSQIVTTYTKQDLSSSVTGVHWSVLDGVVKITWSPNKKLLTRTENNSAIDTGIPPLIYVVSYSHNVSLPVTNWTVTNVTNSTQVEIRGLNIDITCYVMISLPGEDRGTVIIIPPKGILNTRDDTSDDQSFGIILGVVLSVICILICGSIMVLQHRKQRRDPQAPQPSQLRTNRVARSDFECQELVGGPPHIDSKGGVVYMNGLSSVPTKGRGVGEPLLNGHVHITENPRFSSKKHLPAMNGNCRPLLAKKSYGPINDGTLDVSRYEELPDVTVETVLENDLTLCVSNLSMDMSTAPLESAEVYTGISSDGYRQSNSTDPHVDSHISNSNTIELTDGISLHVDKNSNSEVSNVNRVKESIKNDTVDGEKAILNTKSGARILYDKDMEIEKCKPNKFGGNHKIDNLKNNSSLDAISTLDYRENGGFRRLAPALGPNG